MTDVDVLKGIGKPSPTVLTATDKDLTSWEFDGLPVFYLSTNDLQWLTLLARLRGMELNHIPAYQELFRRAYPDKHPQCRPCRLNNHEDCTGWCFCTCNHNINPHINPHQ